MANHGGNHAGDHVDPSAALAEAQLDRLDDDGGGVVRDEPLPHLDPSDELHTDVDLERFIGDDHSDRALAAELLDAIADAFNARDADTMLEYLSEDCETPGFGTDRESFRDELADVWERRPNCHLARATCEREPVGVVWDVDGAGAWSSVAIVYVSDVDADEGCVGVLEIDDAAPTPEGLVASPPPNDFDEGARWEEWEEGAGA